MAERLYCWRCRMVVPMLDEREWSELSPLLKFHREDGTSLQEAWSAGRGEALQRYFELTGFKETNANALWHHRIADFGPPCGECGKPLRTPAAKHCAECGAMRA